eukprot:scaffold20832_cov69-Amphora_coffeaeformis.AAC.1
MPILKAATVVAGMCFCKEIVMMVLQNYANWPGGKQIWRMCAKRCTRNDNRQISWGILQIYSNRK